MPKNDVQLLQEVVDKLGGTIATDLASLRSVSTSAAETAAHLADTVTQLHTANVTLENQLNRLAPARAGNLYSIAAIAATNAQPDLVLLWPAPNRKGATIYNDSAAILYLLVGMGVATSTNFTVAVPGQGYYEVPFTFSGTVRGVWAAATGSARVTEYTL